MITSQIEPQIQQQLIKRFDEGGVWLLLDGVDEMGFYSPVRALDTIQDEETRKRAAEILWRCAENMPYPKFYQLLHQGRGGVFKQLLNFSKRLLRWIGDSI